MVKKKNPIIAAILSFLFGPLGYFYIGWKYFIMASVTYLLFLLLLGFINLDPAILIPEIRNWIKFPLLLILGWKAYTICSVRNTLIDTKDEDVNALNTFPIVAMAMSDLLVGLGIAYAGVIGLVLSIKMFIIGSLFKGVLYLIILTPLLAWIAGLFFGLIATGIDIFFIKKAKNIFRA